MKLNRTKVATKNNQYIDLKTYFKKYIQSYLRWLYEQNSDFAANLTTQELTNFFFNKLEHPLWFQLYLSLVSFRIITETDNYIEKYKTNASKMLVDIPIVLKEKITYLSPVTIDVTYKKASDEDITDIQPIISTFKLKKPEKITEVDVALVNKLRQKFLFIKKG